MGDLDRVAMATETPDLPDGVLYEEHGIHIVAPERGTRYSREEWDHFAATKVFRGRSFAALEALMRDFLRGLRADLGGDGFAAVDQAWRRGLIRNPEGLLSALIGSLQSQLAMVPLRSRTPECLLEMIQRAWTPASIAFKDWLVLMRDPRLYRSDTSPQWVMDHLKGTHAWADCEAITVLFQGLRYGSHPGSLIPTWREVASGHVSINRVRAAMAVAAERERAHAVDEAYERARDLAAVVAILAAHFARGGSIFPTTLTRLLLDRSRGGFDIGRQCQDGGCAGTLRMHRLRIIGPVLPRDQAFNGLLHLLPLLVAAASIDPSPEGLRQEPSLRHQAKVAAEAGVDPRHAYRAG